MRTVRTMAALLIVAAGTAVAAAGCGEIPNCYYTPAAPTVTMVNGRPWIQAVVTSGCDVQRPSTFQMRVAIEREWADGWEPVNPGTGEFADCEEPPSPGHPITCTRQVPCVADGSYRTTVTVTGTVGDRDIAYHENHPPASVLECSAS